MNEQQIKEKLLTTIPPQLVKGRRGLNLSQKIMASAVGISERTYKRLELGESLPTIETALKISELLKIDLNKLLKV
jgi:DNA-binding XRE family transcriptional regulator